MSARLRKATPRLAALALLALAVLLVLGTFVHTDDGCAVERHCLACRFALHTAEGAASITIGPLTLDPSEEVRPARTERRASGQTVVRTTRGPPAA